MTYICLYIIIHILTFISFTNAIFTHLTKGEEFCVYKSLTESTSFSGSYVVSGYNEDSIAMTIYSPSSNKVIENLSMREGKFDIITAENGVHKICYKALDNKPKVLSFDFTTDKKNEKLAATTENIDQVSLEIKKVYKSLESVFRNQHYQHTREDTHRRNIGSLETKVKWSAFIKILVLTLIAIGQVYILTSLFKGRKDLPVQMKKEQ